MIDGRSEPLPGGEILPYIVYCKAAEPGSGYGAMRCGMTSVLGLTWVPLIHEAWGARAEADVWRMRVHHDRSIARCPSRCCGCAAGRQREPAAMVKPLCCDGFWLLRILPTVPPPRFAASVQHVKRAVQPGTQASKCLTRVHSDALGEFSAVAGESRPCASVLTVQVRAEDAVCSADLLHLCYPHQRTSVEPIAQSRVWHVLCRAC